MSTEAVQFEEEKNTKKREFGGLIGISRLYGIFHLFTQPACTLKQLNNSLYTSRDGRNNQDLWGKACSIFSILDNALVSGVISVKIGNNIATFFWLLTDGFQCFDFDVGGQSRSIPDVGTQS